MVAEPSRSSLREMLPLSSNSGLSPARPTARGVDGLAAEAHGKLHAPVLGRGLDDPEGPTRAVASPFPVITIAAAAVAAVAASEAPFHDVVAAPAIADELVTAGCCVSGVTETVVAIDAPRPAQSGFQSTRLASPLATLFFLRCLRVFSLPWSSEDAASSVRSVALFSATSTSLDGRRLHGGEEEEEKDVEEEQEEEEEEDEDEGEPRSRPAKDAPPGAAAAVGVADWVDADDLVAATPGRTLDGSQPTFAFAEEDTPPTDRAASGDRWLVVVVASSLHVGNVKPGATTPPPDAGRAEDAADVAAALA